MKTAKVNALQKNFLFLFCRNMGQEPPAPPPTFKLIPVKTEKDTAPPPTPQTATTRQKPTLETIDRQVLHTVDDHAIQVRYLLPSQRNSFFRNWVFTRKK